MKPATLEQYVRHAELFGADCVYETAELEGQPHHPRAPPDLAHDRLGSSYFDSFWRFGMETSFGCLAEESTRYPV
jgi:hypothetical protein